MKRTPTRKDLVRPRTDLSQWGRRSCAEGPTTGPPQDPFRGVPPQRPQERYRGVWWRRAAAPAQRAKNSSIALPSFCNGVTVHWPPFCGLLPQKQQTGSVQDAPDRHQRLVVSCRPAAPHFPPPSACAANVLSASPPPPPPALLPDTSSFPAQCTTRPAKMLAFASAFGGATALRAPTAFAGCRVAAPAAPAAARWTMVKSKAIPFLEAPPALDGSMIGGMLVLSFSALAVGNASATLVCLRGVWVICCLV